MNTTTSPPPSTTTTSNPGPSLTTHRSNISSSPTVADVLDYIPIGHPDSMMSTESVRRAVEEFRVPPHPRPTTDILVATFPKTGTTVVTWICHLLRRIVPAVRTVPALSGSLRTRHDDDDADERTEEEGNYAVRVATLMETLETTILQEFETIYEVVPWPLLSWDIGYDPNLGQYDAATLTASKSSLPSLPRIFKSHLRMGSIYRGCKYIVTVRDPAATTRSFYNFFLSKKVPFLVDVDVDVDADGNPKIKMDVSQFLMDMPFVQGIPEQNIRASIWEYYYEYHQLLACRDVLILVYEDVVQDMPTAIQHIGSFMGLLTSPNTTEEDTTTHTTDNVIRELITRMTTKDYMAQYMSKFDEPYERAKHFNRSADLCQLAPGHKIRIETNAPHTHQQQQQQQQFSNEALEFLKAQWNKTMNNKDTDNCNYASYHDFVETIRKRNTSLFGYE